jgi:hypothetical protein
MRTPKSHWTIWTVLFLIVGFGFAANAEDRGPLTVAGFAESVDTTKKTSLFVKQFWSDVKGQEVTWSGKVKDVKGRRGKAEVFVANKDWKTHSGYNLVLVTRDVSSAGRLEIDQLIRFTGKLHKYKATREGTLNIIFLSEVEFH